MPKKKKHKRINEFGIGVFLVSFDIFNLNFEISCLSVKTVQTVAQLSRGYSKTETALKA